MRVGYTKWARQTIDSAIFIDKPDKWFKIWFYIVNRVNFTDSVQYERGECFITTQEISEATKATQDQIKKCLRWCREVGMVSSARSTRGLRIKVIKYNVYQSNDFYSSTREAPEKHQRSTTIGEEGKKERTVGDKSPGDTPPLLNNKDDMSWNKQSEDYEEGIVNIDSDMSLVVEKKKDTRKYPNAPAIRKIFQEVLGKNPADWNKNVTVLQACENLYTERGVEKVRNALEFYKENQDKEFCPVINSPVDLDRKYVNLSRFKTSV